MQCAEGDGLHIAEDHFYCEILDPVTLEPVPEGEWGELVITTLTRECCPLVRYRTRDITRIISSPAPAGHHRRIDKLRGRTDDMLIIRGVNVFPSQIEQVITEFRRSPRIIRSSSPRVDRLITSSFRLKPSPSFPHRRDPQGSSRLKRLSAELKSNLQIAVDVRSSSRRPSREARARPSA